MNAWKPIFLTIYFNNSLSDDEDSINSSIISLNFLYLGFFLNLYPQQGHHTPCQLIKFVWALNKMTFLARAQKYVNCYWHNIFGLFIQNIISLPSKIGSYENTYDCSINHLNGHKKGYTFTKEIEIISYNYWFQNKLNST